MTLNCYEFEFSRNFAGFSRFGEATTAKRMYYQRQNCSVLNVIFSDVKITLIGPIVGRSSDRGLQSDYSERIGDFQPIYAKISRKR